MDIKIGAVFSLAPSFDQTPICSADLTSTDEHAHTPIDVQIKRELISPENDSEIDVVSDSADMQYQMELMAQNEVKLNTIPVPVLDCMALERLSPDNHDAESTDSASSTDNDIGDLDSPPSLKMESSFEVGMRSMFYDVGLESMAPPVLQLESERLEDPSPPGNLDGTQGSARFQADGPAEQRRPARKRQCTRIDPSYIVLTNVHPFIQPKTSLSYRRFKHMYRECTNMCKKHHFKRRLVAGRDVFDVKTPSKQRDYQYYLWKEEKDRKLASSVAKTKKKVIKMCTLPNLFQKLDSKIARTNKVSGGAKKTAGRVRRLINRVPKDFTIHHYESTVESEKQKSQEQKEQLAREQEEERLRRESEKAHRRELTELKSQIRLKRISNKRVKELKKALSKDTPIYFKSGTSNISGRVRKVNKRYANFAVSKTEVSQYGLVQKIREKMLMKDNLKIKLKKQKEEEKKQQSHVELKRKSFDVIIDNPEECKEKKLKIANIDRIDEKDNGISVKERKKKNKKKSTGTTEKKYNRRKNIGNVESTTKVSKDGVLIQEMPNESSFLTGLLNNDYFGSPSSESENDTNKEAETDSVDKYAFAKSILKACYNKNEPNSQANSKLNIFINKSKNAKVKKVDNLKSKEMVEEKNKQLRIPEKVQKLFKVKTEPIDNADMSEISKMDFPGSQHAFKALLASTSKPQPIAQRPVPISVCSEASSVTNIKVQNRAYGDLKPGTYTIGPNGKVTIAKCNTQSKTDAMKVKFIPPILKSSLSTVTNGQTLPPKGQSANKQSPMHSILKVQRFDRDKTIIGQTWSPVKTNKQNIVTQTQQTTSTVPTFLNAVPTCAGTNLDYTSIAPVTLPTTLTTTLPHNAVINSVTTLQTIPIPKSSTVLPASQATLLLPKSVIPATTNLSIPPGGTFAVPTRRLLQSTRIPGENDRTITSIVPVQHDASVDAEHTADKTKALLQHIGAIKVSSPSTSLSASSQLVQLVQSMSNSFPIALSDTNLQANDKQFQTSSFVPQLTNTKPQTVIKSDIKPESHTASPVGLVTGSHLGNINEKSKFYLLRVDGKNILIPVQGVQAQPRAYIINSDNEKSEASVALKSGQLETSPSKTIPKNATSVSPTFITVRPQEKTTVASSTPAAVSKSSVKYVPSMSTVTKTTNVDLTKNVSNSAVQQKNVVVKLTPVSETECKPSIKVSTSGDLVISASKPEPCADSVPSAVALRTSRTINVVRYPGPLKNDLGVISSISPALRNVAPTPSSNSGVDGASSTENDSKKEETLAAKDTDPKKQLAFAEGMSARQERLQRLKALQKERQKAVEEIRQVRTQSS